MLFNMKLLVFSICVSLSSAAFFHGLQTDRNGAITSIAKQSVGAALANHLATKGNAYGVAGNTQGIAFGVATPVVGGYNQGITYGLATPVVAGNTQGIAYGVATPVIAGNTQGISYGVGTPVVAGYTQGLANGVGSPVVAANSLYAAAPAAAAPAAVSGPFNLYAAAPVVASSAAAAPAAASGAKYSGPLNQNTNLVDYPNGAKVPAEEPAVAAARAAHLNKKAAAAASAPAASSGYGYSGSLNTNTRLVDYPNGAKVPADEPAVAAARAAHLNKKATIAASAPAGSGYGYSGPQNMNTRLVDYPNGAKFPADEPE